MTSGNDDNHLTILLYHGVTDAASRGVENYSGKHIDAATFEAQMGYLRRHCAPVSMDEVVDIALKGNPFPRRAVAVSFDDGFRNNATVAAPILDSAKIPAIFYICAGMIETTRMFWVDMIEDCVNACTRDTIALPLERAEASVFHMGSARERIDCIQAIKTFCKRVCAEERNRVLSELIAASGVRPSSGHSPNYPVMTWDEVRSIHGNPLFTIGGHTLYHDIMTSVPPERMRLDVATCMSLLEFNLGSRLRHFSYPEGQPEHYSEGVIDTLKEFDIVCSPTAIHGTNPPGTSLFHLRRTMVGFMGQPFPFSPE
jgi:Predicted xylanase/chitin deacetylase